MLFTSKVLINSSIQHCSTWRIMLIYDLVLINAYTGVNQRLKNFLMVLLIGGVLTISRLSVVRRLSSTWDLKASQCSVVHFLKLKTVLCSFFCLTLCRGS